jgi:hypothetical protein
MLYSKSFSLYSNAPVMTDHLIVLYKLFMHFRTVSRTRRAWLSITKGVRAALIPVEGYPLDVSNYYM